MIDKQFYSVAEVADVFGVSKWTIYSLIKKGELPAVRIGQQFRISRAALEEYMARRITEGVAGDGRPGHLSQQR